MAQQETVLLYPDCVYHIFSHAVHDNNFFYDDENKRFFLQKWKEYSKGFFKTYAYCLLSNHFHFGIHVESAAVLKASILAQRKERLEEKLTFLKKKFVDKPTLLQKLLDENIKRVAALPPVEDEDLPLLTSKQINNFLSSYVQALNKQRNRKGTLTRERFGRIKVENRTYLKDLVCYIHHNPIHHFGVASYSDWHYSSYNSYTYELENELLKKDTIVTLFGSLEAFKEYHRVYKENKQFKEMEQIVMEYEKKYKTK
ncbi:MAG: hypothetical protein RLZZ292_1287 [Bacteroidota bacterium]|jgi:REP element-mobilizing transposase RayT